MPDDTTYCSGIVRVLLRVCFMPAECRECRTAKYSVLRSWAQFWRTSKHSDDPDNKKTPRISGAEMMYEMDVQT